MKNACLLVLMLSLLAFGEPVNHEPEINLETAGNIAVGAVLVTLLEAELVLNSAILATRPLAGEVVVGAVIPLLTTAAGHGTQNDYEFAADLVCWDVPVVYDMIRFGTNKVNNDEDTVNRMFVETLIGEHLAIAGMAATNYFFEKHLKQRAGIAYDPLSEKVSLAWSKSF